MPSKKKVSPLTDITKSTSNVDKAPTTEDKDPTFEMEKLELDDETSKNESPIATDKTTNESADQSQEEEKEKVSDLPKQKGTEETKAEAEVKDNQVDTYPLTFQQAIKYLTQAFQPVDEDEKRMYVMQPSQISDAEKLAATKIDREQMPEFRRTLTYGEVDPESISEILLPWFDLQDSDIFYDLGCGTGKIVVQVALETLCLHAKGIELMADRAHEGVLAKERLCQIQPPMLTDRITIVEGDIINPPAIADIMDATVIFVNNVCFGPLLMLSLKDKLAPVKNLRRLITLRKICERHSERRCGLKGSFCSHFVHPPPQVKVRVTWAYETTAFLYIRKPTTSEQQDSIAPANSS